MGKKLVKYSKLILLVVLAGILVGVGIYVFRKLDPDHQLIDIENSLTKLAQDLTNQDFEAINKHFTDNAVFIFEDNEVVYSKGIEKLKAEMSSDFNIEFIMRVITSNDGEKMTCTANGKMTLDGKKSYPEYEFQFEKVSPFSWKITKMSAERNDLFKNAFGEN